MRVDPYAHAPRLPDTTPVDIDALFGGGQGERLELEIGPGRGWFIVERLQVDPGLRLLGFEIRRKWASIVDERLGKRGLGTRARVLAEDAKEALPKLPEGCLDVAYVHFPDPWWKKRHQKRLVVCDAVVGELCRVLRPGGELFIQTDVDERAEAYQAVVAKEARLEPAGDAAGLPALADNPYQARSPREHKAIEDGLPVHRFRWRRRA